MKNTPFFLVAAFAALVFVSLFPTPALCGDMEIEVTVGSVAISTYGYNTGGASYSRGSELIRIRARDARFSEAVATARELHTEKVHMKRQDVAEAMSKLQVPAPVYNTYNAYNTNYTVQPVGCGNCASPPPVGGRYWVSNSHFVCNGGHHWYWDPQLCQWYDP